MQINCLIFLSTVNVFAHAQIPLTRGTVTFDIWSKLPAKSMMKVYIYNVTNKDEFLENSHKPALHEIGPYVYQQTWKKTNIKFNKNNTLTYSSKKTFRFIPKLSKGNEKDMVIVPNIPLLTGTSVRPEALHEIIEKKLHKNNSGAFIHITVENYLWGYVEPLMEIIDTSRKEFGIFYEKKNEFRDNLTIFTGVDDINKIGTIDKFNGYNRLPPWKTDSCYSVDGTDGNIFQPNINTNTILRFFNKALCGVLPLKFNKKIISHNGVEGYRFTPSADILFSSTDTYIKCFCSPGAHECASSGSNYSQMAPDPENTCSFDRICTPYATINTADCQLSDAPILLSYPHFYLADDVLRTAVKGISPPDPRKHEFFVDIHPETGVPLTVKGRLQININIKPIEGAKVVQNFPEMIFPILWVEEGIDELPNDITTMLKLASKILPSAQRILTKLLSSSSSILLTFIRLFYGN